VSLDMARAPFLVPTAFVGCPYKPPFKFDAFKQTLSKLPFAWYYADTELSSRHLLSILTTYVKAVDFCIFDLSLWNPNVALELGLTEGLARDYYILVNKKQSKDVPSDLKGLQRIDYSSVSGYADDALLPQLVKYLVKKETHPRRIWNKLSGPNRDKKFYFALAVLAHFRDNLRLGRDDITKLSSGLYLRESAEVEVLDLLDNERLISARNSQLGAKLEKRLYPLALSID
jgi:hypothetical protein